MSVASSPTLIDPPLSSLLERVAERQRLDFGRAAAELKPDGTLVTACDLWSDRTIVQGLQALYPNEGILSEEGDRHLPATSAFWVVDPLDGTTNFAAGIPYWSISLARFQGGRPVLGILEVPPLGLRMIAKAGLGAWRNGVPLAPPPQSPIPGSVCRSAAAPSPCCRSDRSIAFQER